MQENETNSRKTLSRALFMAALANEALWALSVIALIFVIRRCPSAKGLFVILAAGLVAASAITAALPKRT